jgi:putative flippase GtrA
MILDLIKKHRRFITFAAIGGVNTLVDFLVFTAFHELTLLAIELCQALGYSSGLICSFVLNRSLTFRKERTTDLKTQIVRFLIVNGISALFSMLMIKWLDFMGLNAYIAKALVTGAVMIINYVGYKLFVFVVRENAKNKTTEGEGRGNDRQGTDQRGV